MTLLSTPVGTTIVIIIEQILHTNQRQKNTRVVALIVMHIHIKHDIYLYLKLNTNNITEYQYQYLIQNNNTKIYIHTVSDI